MCSFIMNITDFVWESFTKKPFREYSGKIQQACFAACLSVFPCVCISILSPSTFQPSSFLSFSLSYSELRNLNLHLQRATNILPTNFILFQACHYFLFRLLQRAVILCKVIFIKTPGNYFCFLYSFPSNTNRHLH